MDYLKVRDTGDNPFRDKTVVITGTLTLMTRKQIKDYLTSQGANVTGSVSKKTDLVIVGEKSISKYTKAVDLGISIMNESAFKEKIISN